mgnify:CR=1 FL=1
MTEPTTNGVVPAVKATQVHKAFGSLHVLKGVDMTVMPGSVTVILGPSGSGKSTFLRLINQLETLTGGEIDVDGEMIGYKYVDKDGKQVLQTLNDKEVAEQRSKLGMVFQRFNLFPHMTALENVMEAPVHVKHMDKKEARELAIEELNRVGMGDRLDHYPAQLSGGQQQRVAIARALVNDPEVLLLDEPFAAIDAKIRQELRSWLKEMIGKLGITSIFVTHDQDEAIEVADEIIITNAGRIEQKGTPIGVYRNPETAFTASFFGQPSVLKDADDFHTFAQAEGADKIIVRPEFVKISKLDEVEKFKTSVSRGVVERVSFRGDNLELQVRVNNSVVTARRSLEKADIREGETVNVFLYRIFALRGDSVQLIENEAVRDDFVII